jgi:hypothetical protein
MNETITAAPTMAPADWQLSPADAEALSELWAEATRRGWRVDFDPVEPDWSLLGPADETVEYAPPGDISTGTLWIHADGSQFGSTLRATDVATHRVAAGMARLFLGWPA